MGFWKAEEELKKKRKKPLFEFGKSSGLFGLGRLKKKLKKPISQTYWKENRQHVPIWLQRNDDSKLGGHEISIEDLKKSNPKSSLSNNSGKYHKSQTYSDNPWEHSPKQTNQEREILKAVSKRMHATKAKKEATANYIKLRRALATRGRFKKELAYRQVAVQEKLSKGKIPSIKEIKAELKAKKEASLKSRMKGFRRTVQPQAIAGGILAVTAGGLGGKFGGEGGLVGKEGTYTKEARKASERVGKRIKVGLNLLYGPNLTGKKGFNSEPRPRGRPGGPSGSYRIGGKPVYEQAFQDFQAKQRALNRLQSSDLQTQSLNPAYIEQMKAQQRLNEMKRLTKSPDQLQAGEPGVPQQLQAPPQEMPQQPQTLDEVKAAQLRAQQADNIMANTPRIVTPNFMKGELKNIGGGSTILDAPNINQGGMRNVNAPRGDVAEVKLGERPQTNPYSDDYLDIALDSGKPVIKHRPREKWATGEAL